MAARRRADPAPRRRALLAAALGLAVAGPAWAEPAHIFRLPPEPVDTALVRFGVQAGVSVGGFPAAGCGGRSHGVIGVFTPSQALQRLLPTGCGFQRVDARAYRIVAQSPPATPTAPPTPAPPTPTQVDELVVTAEKRREPLRGSPFAVSALGGNEVERLGAKGFADLALQFPGVAETNLGPGRNKIFIRGVSDGAFTGRTQSTVGLYLDEVPITYNAPDPDLRLADIERVEVLRGPQGTLYGSGSIGGIVRIATARPDPTAFAGSVAGEGTVNGHGDSAMGAEAMLNLPLAGGRAALRGVAYVDQFPGYLDNPGLGGEDVNRGRRSGGRLTAMVMLPGGWQAQAGLTRQAIKTDDSQYVTGGGGALVRDTGLREPHDNDFSVISGTISHPGSTSDIRVSGAYIDHDISTRYDASGAFDLGPMQAAAFDDAQRVELWVGEAVAASAGPRRLRWLAGAFASHSRETSSGALDATPSGGARRSVFMRRDHLTEAAVFGELTYDLTPRLTATVGGRLFASRAETNAGGFDLARPAAGRISAELKDEGFSPKLRLSYAFAPDIVLYAQAADGYRAGGFNLPARADGMAGGPDVAGYRPDRLRNYEIGGEAALFERSLTVRAAVFKAVWRNVQTDQFRASGLPVTLNIGDGSNSGIEAEAVWRPDAHWRLRVNGLLDEPQLTRSSNVFPARVDIGLPGVARRTGSLDVTYVFELPWSLRGEVSAQAAYVGRSFLTFDGAAASAMGGYGEGRIAASVRSPDWRIEAYVANVTGAEGDTFAFGNPFSRARTRQATPLPPRTFGLAIRRRF